MLRFPYLILKLLSTRSRLHSCPVLAVQLVIATWYMVEVVRQLLVNRNSVGFRRLHRLALVDVLATEILMQYVLQV